MQQMKKRWKLRKATFEKLAAKGREEARHQHQVKRFERATWLCGFCKKNKPGAQMSSIPKEEGGRGMCYKCRNKRDAKRRSKVNLRCTASD